jgi:hypothetical protein
LLKWFEVRHPSDCMSISGEITAVRCNHCGTAVAPGQRQCHACGHVIAASELPDTTPVRTPTDFGAFSGPRVHAQRGQSADAGGGMVSVFAGWVQIQGSVRSRQLGAMQDLRSVVFRDRQGREATLTFGDGTAWRLEGSEGGELLTFMLEIERRMSVPGLVQQPPPIADELKAAVTPDVKRNAGGVVAACAFAWIVSMLTRIWSPLGYVLIAAVVLAGIGALLGWRELGPPLLSRWHAWCEGSSVIAGALAVALLLGAGIGLSYAAGDRAKAALVQAEVDRKAAAARAEAEAEQHARDAELAKIPPLLALMTQQIEQKAWTEAKATHDAILAIDPKSAGAVAMQPMIERGVAEQVERERRAAFLNAIREIPRAAKDKVQCESAGVVSSLWQGLLSGTPNDPEWGEVAALVPKLEACRRRVVAVYATMVDVSGRGAKARRASDASKQVLAKFGLAEPLRLPSNLVTAPSPN